MSHSEHEDELDPRIQIELEKLNTTTEEINKLEIEYDVSNPFFNKRYFGNLLRRMRRSYDS